jgi:hypothetical protein
MLNHKVCKFVTIIRPFLLLSVVVIIINKLAACYLLQAPKDPRRRSAYIDLEMEELLVKSCIVVVEEDHMTDPMWIKQG